MTKPLPIASPLLYSTFVCFTREVAAETLRVAAGNEKNALVETLRLAALADAVEAGTVDHIGAATWRGGRGEGGRYARFVQHGNGPVIECDPVTGKPVEEPA